MGELVAGKWGVAYCLRQTLRSRQSEVTRDKESGKGEILKVRLWILSWVGKRRVMGTKEVGFRKEDGALETCVSER